MRTTGLCPRCHGSGELDPYEASEGSPMMVWCWGCLGTGDPACGECEGEGAIPTPVPCPDCIDDVAA